MLKSIFDLISLKGKRALVTGAASGIGRAIALRFGEVGADLELVDINLDGLKKVRDELSMFNVEVNLHRVDLSVKEEIDSLWDAIGNRAPDILVNNAGIFPFKDFLEVDAEFLDRIMRVNLYSVFWMCQHMIGRRIKMGKGGVIVNVSSIEALIPLEEKLSHYCISKSGIIALTRSLAKEYGGHGFRINAILLGGIKTPGAMRAAKALGLRAIKIGREYLERVPLGRMGDPDEVARIVLVLASELSTYVHGALIVIDGGVSSS